MSAIPSASDGFRAACDPIWRALHDHPFITELAAGTLPLERFRFFLEQDNFYLEEYARCLAMGAAKSRTEAELRYFTTDLNQVLDAELPSNRTLLERVIEMGAADRGGSPRDGPRQRRVHELHAFTRAARRSARDHGVAPAVRVELRRDRRRSAGTHRSRSPRLRRMDRLLQPSRRTSRWSMRCVGTSTRSSPRRSPRMPGATTSPDLRHELPARTVLLGHGVHARTVARPGGAVAATSCLDRVAHADVRSRPSRCDT